MSRWPTGSHGSPSLSLPFLIGWVAGLVVVLAPVDRWLAAAARGATDGDDDADPKRLARACRAASAAPRWFALLYVFGLAPHTWVGARQIAAA